MSLELHLVLANDQAELARLASEVARLLEPLDVNPRAQYVIDLVLEEMVLNVINHAFETPGPREIKVDVTAADGVVLIRIEDDGKPFDPVKATEPDTTLPVEERPIGGLGIHLVRKMAQGMSYERVGWKNVLTVRVSLAGDAAA
jgi:anti-sigma regulatory factor (Ser/Thr protein kinase)